MNRHVFRNYALITNFSRCSKQLCYVWVEERIYENFNSLCKYSYKFQCSESSAWVLSTQCLLSRVKTEITKGRKKFSINDVFFVYADSKLLL